MRELWIFSVVATLFLSVVGGPAVACVPSTSAPEVDVAWPDGSRTYLDIDCVELNSDCVLPAFWVYEEANGIPGLQRSDDIVDDTCSGAIDPDELMSFRTPL